MDTARNSFTGQIIEAELLWLTPPLAEDNYTCRGCQVVVIPCSYLLENKRRPYFRSKEKHEPDCDINGELELVKKGRNGKVSGKEGFPGRYPIGLSLKDERMESDNQPPGNPQPKISAARSSSNNSSADAKGHGHYKPNTIRPICRFFINFPYDRHLALTINGVKGKSYQSIFRYLATGEPEQYRETKIYYACIKWRSIIESEEFLEIELLPKGHKDEAYKARIYWKNWSRARRNYIQNEIIAGTKEAIEAKNTKKKGRLFFIGKQDDKNPNIFNIDDHRLVCYIVDEILYPKKI